MTKVQTRVKTSSSSYGSYSTTTRASNTIVDRAVDSPLQGDNGEEVFQHFLNYTMAPMGAGANEPFLTAHNQIIAHYDIGKLWTCYEDSSGDPVLSYWQMNQSGNFVETVIDMGSNLTSMPIDFTLYTPSNVMGWTYIGMGFEGQSSITFYEINDNTGQILNLVGIGGACHALCGTRTAVYYKTSSNIGSIEWSEVSSSSITNKSTSCSFTMDKLVWWDTRNIVLAVGATNSGTSEIRNTLWEEREPNNADTFFNSNNFTAGNYLTNVDYVPHSMSAYMIKENRTSAMRYHLGSTIPVSFSLPSVPYYSYNSGEEWNHIYEYNGMLFLIGTHGTIMCRSMLDTTFGWRVASYRGMLNGETTVSTATNPIMIFTDEGYIFVVETTGTSPRIWRSESFIYKPY